MIFARGVMIRQDHSYNELTEIKKESANMTDENRTAHIPHSVTMTDRRNLTLTGVEEVIGCDEDELTVKTSLGKMTVGGRGMHIGSFNKASGELKIDGTIQELVYAEPDPETRGFFKRLFN